MADSATDPLARAREIIADARLAALDGNLQGAQNMCKEATGLLDELARTGPDDPGPWLCRGEMTSGLSQIRSVLGDAEGGLKLQKDSVEAYEKAISLSPGNLDAHRGLAGSLWRCGNMNASLGDNLEALADMRRLAASVDRGVRFGPDNAAFRGDMLNLKGVAHGMIADLQPGLDSFETIVASYKAAVACFVEASSAMPDAFESHNNAGLACMKLAMVHEAAGNRAQAMGGAANGMEPAAYLEGVEKHLGEAISNFDQAILRRPDLAEAHDNLSSALGRLSLSLDREGGKSAAERTALVERALEASRKAQSLEPDRPDFAYNGGLNAANLGNLRMEAGDAEGAGECFEDAIRMLGLVLEMDPSDTAVQGKIELIEEKLADLKGRK